MAPHQTYYANIVQVRITPNELAFEFGVHFPNEAPVPGQPISFDPEVRVVLSLAALKTLSETLQNAMVQVETQQRQQQNLPQPEPARTTSKQ